MSEDRFCPHCQKKLRRDNSKGVCGTCQSKGRTIDGSYGDARSVKRAPATTSAKTVELPPTKEVFAFENSEVMPRFRKVTEALGLDPEVLLIEAAQAWLDQAQALLNGTDDEG